MKTPYTLPDGSQPTISQIVNLCINFAESSESLQEGLQESMYAYDYDLDVKFKLFKEQYLVRKFVPVMLAHMRKAGILPETELPTQVRPRLYNYYLDTFKAYCEEHKDRFNVPADKQVILQKYAAGMFDLLVKLSTKNDEANNLVYEIMGEVRKPLPVMA